MAKENDKVRIHDERLAIFEFGRFVERTMEDAKKAGVKSVRLDFRDGSPDAALFVEGKDGDFSLEIEFEGCSKNFKSHLSKNENMKCDLIICSLHDWKDSTLPVWEICYGGINTFEPHEGIKGSFYEQLMEITRKEKLDQK